MHSLKFPLYHISSTKKQLLNMTVSRRIDVLGEEFIEVAKHCRGKNINIFHKRFLTI